MSLHLNVYAGICFISFDLLTGNLVAFKTANVFRVSAHGVIICNSINEDLIVKLVEQFIGLNYGM
jgi:hypothetical protein